jgi:hypothetical protein
MAMTRAEAEAYLVRSSRRIKGRGPHIAQAPDRRGSQTAELIRAHRTEKC